jgi:parvulin-like peptidyl-prolyl isomerase
MRPRPLRSPARPAGIAPAALLLASAWSAGCSTPPPATPIGPLPPEVLVDGRPVALVDGVGAPWEDLRPALLEAAGGEVLAEWILQRRIEAALLEADRRLGPGDMEAEQRLLLEQLAPDPDEAARLLARLRDRRALGPVRYAALLRRNAGLRALVAEQVRVTPEDVRAAFDRVHGPRRQVRLIVVPDLGAAATIREAVVSEGRRFADLAAERSTDLSAARGGLLEPFARLEPGLPESLRRAGFALDEPGEVSEPILLPEGVAIVQLVAETPGDGTEWEAGRAAAERQARLAAERVAMERLARDLTATASVTPLDPSMREAWQRRRRTLADD